MTGQVVADMPKDAPIRLSSIGQIAINVQDLNRATEFYRDTLGMKYLFAAGNMSFFDCGGVRLMLAADRKQPRSNSILYYKVSDIQAVRDKLASARVHIEVEPHFVAPVGAHDLWLAFFRDSEENLMALMSEVKR